VGSLYYRSVGLSRAQAEIFLARPEPLAWAFAALGRPKDRDRHELRRSCFAKIASAEELTDVERFLLFNCVATYLELDGGAAEEYAALRARFKKPEAEMKPVTWEEKVEERGKENGMREVLLRLLRSRFPSLNRQVVARVEAIRSPEELGSLAERLLTARSLEELGLA